MLLIRRYALILLPYTSCHFFDIVYVILIIIDAAASAIMLPRTCLCRYRAMRRRCDALIDAIAADARCY